MKFKNLLGLSMALLLFVSCKKDKPFVETPIAIEKEDPLEYAKDSISYSIDGITYNISRFSSLSGATNLEPYSKIDSIVNNAYYISGIKDSVMYSRHYRIYNDQHNVNVTFIKTYSKASMIRPLLLFKPRNILGLFTVGPRDYPIDYPIDYERNNIQNGIALDLSNGFKTYGPGSFITPLQLSADAQKNSKFEIISLRKLSSGTHILEAKFNATVFNKKNKSKNLENGYLRLVLSKYDHDSIF